MTTASLERRRHRLPDGRPRRGAVLVIAWALAVGAVAKTAPPLAERLTSADALALGVVTDLRAGNQPTMANGRLHVTTGLKGLATGKTVPVRIYGSGADDGCAALWLLKRDAQGGWQETYPWLRVEPDLWPSLPQATRDPVYRAVDHAVGATVDGIRLHLFRVPTLDPRQVTVWLGIENVSDAVLSVPYTAQQKAVSFSLALPGGRAVRMPLLRDADLRALQGGKPPHSTLAGHNMLLVRRPGGQPGGATQLQLATADQAGYCRIRARLELPDEGPTWHGRTEVVAATNIAK